MCVFFQETWPSNMVTTTTRRIAKQTQLNQFYATFCEPVSRVVSNVAIGASPVRSLFDSRVRLRQSSKKMASPSCHRSSKHERRGISHGTLPVDVPRKVSLMASTICMHWELGSHVFTQCGARVAQAYDKHTKTWDEFESSFIEYVKGISLVLPSHQRRDRKSPITPLEFP